MRVLAALTMFVAVVAWSGTALAGEFMLHERTVEFRIVEPCDVVVFEGEVSLAWDDCGGGYTLFTFQSEDAHPLSVLFFVGTPDWSTLDPHVYQSFFCECRYTCRRPDVYCADFDECRWYCYKTEVKWGCDTICVYAYLPCNMALDILDVY